MESKHLDQPVDSSKNGTSNKPMNDVLEHLKYIRNLSQKPYKVIENDYLMAQHGRAIVGRNNVAGGLFLINRITEESIQPKDREAYIAHRVYVTSTGGGSYCDIGWMVQEEVHDCMCCQEAFIEIDSVTCVNCGSIVCPSCGKNETLISSIHDTFKFSVCARCFNSLTDSRNKTSTASPCSALLHRVSTVSRLDSTDREETEKIATVLADVIRTAPATDANQHLSFIRSLTRRPIFEVKRAYQQAQQGRALIKRKSSFIVNRSQSAIVEAYIISKLTTEKVVIDNRTVTAYRVYVTSTGGGDYCKVGWVLMENISACMICHAAFGLLTNNKHHCLACGDVICAKCSPNKSIIAELRSNEVHRVCRLCHLNSSFDEDQGRTSVQISTAKRPSATPEDEAIAEPAAALHLSARMDDQSATVTFPAEGEEKIVDLPLPPESTPQLVAAEVQSSTSLSEQKEIVSVAVETVSLQLDPVNGGSDGKLSEQSLFAAATDPSTEAEIQQRLSVELTAVVSVVDNDTSPQVGEGKVTTTSVEDISSTIGEKNAACEANKIRDGAEDEEEGGEHPIIRDLEQSLDEVLFQDKPFSDPIALNSVTVADENVADDASSAESEKPVGSANEEEKITWLEDVLSSDGETAVIPVRRLSNSDQSALKNRGYVEDGSEYAFIPRWQIQLRRVQPAQKREIIRAPSARSLVQLRPVEKNT